jgi:hypothetical protein
MMSEKPQPLRMSQTIDKMLKVTPGMDLTIAQNS